MPSQSHAQLTLYVSEGGGIFESRGVGSKIKEFCIFVLKQLDHPSDFDIDSFLDKQEIITIDRPKQCLAWLDSIVTKKDPLSKKV